MTNPPQSPEFPVLKSPSLSPLLLATVVLLIALGGGAFVYHFIGRVQERELVQWQTKLGLIADSRAADLDAWFDRYFRELGTVAGNPSLQLYLTELQAPQNSAPAEDPAQATFLRNLLSITADRLGFVAPASAELQSINAEVHPPSGVGLAIVDAKGKFLVGTAGLAAIDDDVAAKIAALPLDKPALIDLFTTPDGTDEIGFVVPIYPIDVDTRSTPPLGRLVGIKPVDKDLFGLLQQPGAPDKNLQAVLLRKEGDNVAYLSAPKNAGGAAPRLALDTPQLDAAYALTSPSDFAVRRDAQGHATLMTSRPVAHTPWVMMLHIDRDRAFHDSAVWLAQIVYTLLFALLAMIGGVVAVWFYGTSKRVLLLSREVGRMAARATAQELLLRVVADNQIEPILIAGQDNIARFANARAAQAFHVDAADVVGKELAALMGVALARGYSEGNRQALENKTAFVRTWTREDQTPPAIIRSVHVPLDHVPVEGLPVPSPGTLIVDQDITEIVNERKHRMRILRQLIDILVQMVDSRDPYAASHSAGVAFIAKHVAVALGLEERQVEAAETAAKLMNIGKIIVPSEVLTRAAPLNESEMRAIHFSVNSSIALLKDIEFDGPVVDTLRQSHEFYNGQGPLGLRGEDIIITARIIAAANAFIGMISPRSYRLPIGIEESIRILLSRIDIQFDRRVVVALADYVENKGGRAALAALMAKG